MNNIGKNEITTIFLNTLNVNAEIMFNNVWPANILAKRRIDKLKGLIKYETNSITTKNGINTVGTPLGTNKFKNCNLLLKKPIMVIPTNNEKAI